MNIIGALKCLFNPIEQDKTAIMYTEVHGYAVRLVPKTYDDNTNVVKEWIPDPECVAFVNSLPPLDDGEDDEVVSSQATQPAQSACTDSQPRTVELDPAAIGL